MAPCEPTETRMYARPSVVGRMLYPVHEQGALLPSIKRASRHFDEMGVHERKLERQEALNLQLPPLCLEPASLFKNDQLLGGQTPKQRELVCAGHLGLRYGLTI